MIENPFKFYPPLPAHGVHLKRIITKCQFLLPNSRFDWSEPLNLYNSSRQTSTTQTTERASLADTVTLNSLSDLVEVPVDESDMSGKLGALLAEGAMRNFEDPTKNREGLGEMPAGGDSRITKPDLASGTGFGSVADEAQALTERQNDLRGRFSAFDLGSGNDQGQGWYQGLGTGINDPGDRQDNRDQSQQDKDALVHAAGGKTLNDAASKHMGGRNPSSSDPNYSGTDTGDDGDDGVVDFSEDEVEPVAGGTDSGDDGDDGVVNFSEDEEEPVVGGTDTGDDGDDGDGLVRIFPMTQVGVDELSGAIRQGGTRGAWTEGYYGFALGCLVADLIWPSYSPVNGPEYMPNPENDYGGSRNGDPDLSKLRGRGAISQPIPGAEGGQLYQEFEPRAGANGAKRRQQWATMPTEDDQGEETPRGEIEPPTDTGDPPDPDLL